MTDATPQAPASHQGASDPALIDELCALLVRSALPGESEGFDPGACGEAASFIAAAAAVRTPGQAIVRIESSGGAAGDQRRMRMALVNDDMPFLVDSVAAAIASRGLTIHRLLHPVVPVARDARGALTGLTGGASESIIYVELDRADARDRRDLAAGIEAVLADVRAAVTDWPRMRDRLLADADALAPGEAADLLRWFAADKVTLLGQQRVARGAIDETLRADAGQGLHPGCGRVERAELVRAGVGE